MYSKKLMSYTLLLLMMFTFFLPAAVTQAASIDSVLGAMTSPTAASGDGGGGLLNSLFSLLFDKILGPIFNIFSGGGSSGGSSPVKITPQPGGSGTITDNGVLRGKVIVVDPGHGGNNPGATGNGSIEAANNLAVGLKLRDKLQQAGAKVYMTRETDRNVAPVGSTLGEELQARVDLAESKGADLFVSVHSNDNPDPKIAGAMTFYSSGKSSKLASEVQSALVQATGAANKGTSSATFYVLRNTTMPSILVEMGFVSNPQEAAKLNDNSYRNKVAQGVFNGLVQYFQKS
ncbi:MAG TPA: N-acetylmuramoyl-L-alanine amidase [Selenomonadales bacterium]|nr:N-acetylmuramoyl-L-alanine amidase [Selenomonadales bacterium]